LGLEEFITSGNPSIRKEKIRNGNRLLKNLRKHGAIKVYTLRHGDISRVFSRTTPFFGILVCFASLVI
jgi:hypothetical protein